MYHIVAVLVI